MRARLSRAPGEGDPAAGPGRHPALDRRAAGPGGAGHLRDLHLRHRLRSGEGARSARGARGAPGGGPRRTLLRAGEMAHYLVTATPREELLAELSERLERGEFVTLRP